MVDKLCENILLNRVLHEVEKRGLQRYEELGFRPSHNSTMQLARLVEGVYRKYEVNLLTWRGFHGFSQSLRQSMD